MNRLGEWVRGAAIGAFLLLAGCANSGTGQAPPETVGKVDLARYQGVWYEIARLPMPYQEGCTESEAHYRLLDDGDMGVTNRCRGKDGEWREVQGRAEANDAERNDRLTVAFDAGIGKLLPALASGDYWILDLDDDYQLALVGSPDRSYLWVLSRETRVDPDDLKEVLIVARKQGYDIDPLIWRNPEDAPPRT